MKNKTNMRKIYKITAAAVFVMTVIISTATAASVDNGSWVILDPLTESGHYMTLREAILHNLTPAIVEGIVYAGIAVALLWAVNKCIEHKEYFRYLAERAKARCKHGTL